MKVEMMEQNRQTEWEVIERKGRGHPDTLSDALAERLSVEFSKYTIDRFGAILHHNFDKVGIMGGSSHVSFGESFMKDPIRVLLNGRASYQFADGEIPVRDILTATVMDFFQERFGGLLKPGDIRIMYELSTASTPGAVQGFEGSADNPRNTWFAPRSLDDLPELSNLNCNDTSAGVYTPNHSPLSRLVLGFEDIVRLSPINSDQRIGTDIKVMGIRSGRNISLTAAVPQMAGVVGSIDEFFDTLQAVKSYVAQKFLEENPEFNLDITLNPLDNRSTGDVYLTHTGSCIETGDEGFVGRGNRPGGLIRINRPMSMEGVAGKNPVYHAGKVLSGAAIEAADRAIAKGASTEEEVTLYLVGQRGKSLEQPWAAAVEGSREHLDRNGAIYDAAVREVLNDLGTVTNKFLKNGIRLF